MPNGSRSVAISKSRERLRIERGLSGWRSGEAMEVTVKRGALIHTAKGELLYAEWPDGSFTRNGKRITKAEAKAISKQAANGEDAQATEGKVS